MEKKRSRLAAAFEGVLLLFFAFLALCQRHGFEDHKAALSLVPYLPPLFCLASASSDLPTLEKERAIAARLQPGFKGLEKLKPWKAALQSVCFAAFHSFPPASTSKPAYSLLLSIALMAASWPAAFLSIPCLILSMASRLASKQQSRKERQGERHKAGTDKAAEAAKVGDKESSKGHEGWGGRAKK